MINQKSANALTLPQYLQYISMITSTTSDARLKRYETSIDKLLLSFESITEWADIISFLARLIKVHSFNQFTDTLGLP